MQEGGRNMVGMSVALRDLANPALHQNQVGVYILRLNGKVMKVGCAKIGLQKRMQQYYALNPWCGLNHHINVSNRNSIRVDYQVCSLAECSELESKLFDKYGRFTPLPWAQRRPHVMQDTVVLQI